MGPFYAPIVPPKWVRFARQSPQDRKNAHYWRIKFSLSERKDNRWELSAFVEIGKRPLSEPAREEYIKWITTTEDSPFYAQFTAPVTLFGPDVLVSRNNQLMIAVDGSGGKIVDPTKKSKLTTLLRKAFELCKTKILK